VASVPPLSCRLAELLSQRVRDLLRLREPGDELLTSRRSDGEAILAERPHLDRESRTVAATGGKDGLLARPLLLFRA
jgi:hypothetical protein